MNSSKRFLILLTLALANLAPTGAFAQVISQEARLKGQMVALVSQLVTWPANKKPTATNPLTIGIVGVDPFTDAGGINYLQDKLGNTARILYYATPADIKECHILVISDSTDFKQAVANARGKSSLIVSDSPGRASEGAAINLVFDPNTNRIRMEINPVNAVREGVRISRSLLRSKLVDIVE